MSIFGFMLRWHSQYPDKPEIITANLLKFMELAPNLLMYMRGWTRKFIFKNLMSELHEFVAETKCVLRHVFSPLPAHSD